MAHPHLRKRNVPLMILVVASSVLVGLSLATGATNNQGTIKVHNPGSQGDESNDPHVGCAFFVEGFNMEATLGTLVIQSWPPTGNGTVVLDTAWASNDVVGDAFADHHFLNGPYSLAAGHYKLFVSDAQHDKMKTFWVDCEAACPEGEVRDDAGDCVPTPCLDGEVRNEAGECVPTPCADGEIRDELGQCVPTPCLGDEVRNDAGDCVPAPCPEGETYDDVGACVPIPCPEGEVRNDAGDCVLAPCPEGQLRNDAGQCGPEPCLEGEERNEQGECVPTTIPGFPTALSVGLGVLGALGGSFAILRRKT